MRAQRLLQHVEGIAGIGLRARRKSTSCRATMSGACCLTRPTTRSRSKRGLRPTAPWMFQVITRTICPDAIAHARSLPRRDTQRLRRERRARSRRSQATISDHDVRDAGIGQMVTMRSPMHDSSDQARHHADRGAEHEIDEADAAGAGREVDQGEGRDRHEADRQHRQHAALAHALRHALSARGPAAVAALPGRTARRCSTGHEPLASAPAAA